MGKHSERVSVISGADGPTSIFIAGKNEKAKISERVKRACYKRKRRNAAKKVIANPHTLGDVVKYLKNTYAAVEISEQTHVYQEQYHSLRESLIIRYRPELLGEFSKIEKPEEYDETSLKEFLGKIELRSQRTKSIPEEVFPMDFHIYEIKVPEICEIQVCIETIWNIFGAGFSGKNKRAMKQLNRIIKDIYLYYGVSKEDIKNHSERYSSLVTILES